MSKGYVGADVCKWTDEQLNIKLAQLHVVCEVHKLLSDESKWCKGVLAHGEYREVSRALVVGLAEIEPEAPEAIAWCMLGAAIKIMGPNPALCSTEVAQALGFDGCPGVTTYNDSYWTTHPELMAHLDRREAALRAEIASHQ